MKIRIASILLAAAAMAGCASPPLPTTLADASSSCTDLATGMARADEALRTAREKEETAWKAIVPFMVIGRAATSHTAAVEAEGQLAQLRAQSSRQGCAR